MLASLQVYVYVLLRVRSVHSKNIRKEYMLAPREVRVTLLNLAKL